MPAESTTDLTTDRAVHLAAFRHAYGAALVTATWWAYDGEEHAATNVVVTAPVVTHFRAPLPGGMVEVQNVDGSWSPSDMTVDGFKYLGPGADTEDADYAGPVFAYTVAAFTV